MTSFVINTAHVTSEIFGEEAVVVNFMTGKYFGMTGSAPAIWKLFKTPASYDDVMVALTNGSVRMSEEETGQVKAFIDALLQEELIVDAGTTEYKYNGVQSAPIIAALNAFETPVLEVFDDLQELIVLDPIHDTDPERGWPVQQNLLKPE